MQRIPENTQGNTARKSGRTSGQSGSVTAYIGLGSNIEAESNLRAARSHLDATPGIVLTAASRVYRTPPWGFADQPPFLNAVLAMETTLEPLELLDCLLDIESRQMRERTIRYGPRTLDLDLLLYGSQAATGPRLTVPHPLLHERAFVLVPLCDLAPEFMHPVLGRPMKELLSRVERTGIEPVEFSLELPGPR